jgi:hypothetical protein
MKKRHQTPEQVIRRIYPTTNESSSSAKCDSSNMASIHFIAARLFTSHPRISRRLGREQADARASCRPTEIEWLADSW